MEFRQLEAFISVASLKSFSKAANDLYLSQSTVSSHIKNLEKELQKKLILRTTKTLQLTDDGMTFLNYAKRILETRDAALESLNTPSDSIIRLGASTIPSGYLIPELLSSFRQTHPYTYFNITQSDSEKTLAKVLDGSLEIGLIGENASSPNCVCIPFCADELMLVTPATPYYLALNKKKPDLLTLLREPIIMRKQGSGTLKAANRFLNSLPAAQENFNIIARVNDLESIKQMIVNGMGISILSGFAVKDLLKQGRVIAYPLPAEFTRNFYMVYLKSKVLNATLQEFIQHTLHYFI